ncbi:hypothetical protein AB6A40_000209 [Gnathostoma spinigerum]|uniref:Translation initiation factor eIF2B subunit gamma n=1 Tax=Gnathostoma spinigerum TaxID=75299 RepID=A0ABD6EB20_9BILA
MRACMDTDIGQWQAVVFCGGVGYRMTDLTDHIPKCMLPIAGVPMFWYPLNFLQNNGIKDVLLIVQEKLADEIKSTLASGALPKLSELKIELIPLSSSTEEWGTADILRSVSNKIKRDILVVSGDFISDFNINRMINLHRAEGSSLTCLLAENVVNGPIPGLKIKRSRGRDLIALSSPSNQVVFLGSEEDFDESVPLSTALFSKFKNVFLTAKYNDCHVYIMKRWILEVLDKNRNLSSIKVDLIPYLLEQQYCPDSDINRHLGMSRLATLANRLSFGAPLKEDRSSLKCFGYAMKLEDASIVAHANTIGAYFEVNKAILRLLTSRFSAEFPMGIRVGPNLPATISESYVGKGTKFVEAKAGNGTISRSDKTVIKRSVIGPNCQIGIRAKISGSLIMKGCIIGEGVQITNSILCPECKIGDDSQITLSIIVNNQDVPVSSKISNEVVAPEDEMEYDERV